MPSVSDIVVTTNKKISLKSSRLLLNHFAAQVFVDTGTIVHTKTLCDTKNGTLMTREQCKGSELCLS